MFFGPIAVSRGKGEPLLAEPLDIFGRIALIGSSKHPCDLSKLQVRKNLRLDTVY